jgi:hypothetical protein
MGRHEIPEPAHPARDDEVSTSAKRLAAKIGAGWSCSAQASCGEIDGKEIHLLTLHLYHLSGARAVALWENDKFSKGFTWVICTDPDCVNVGYGEHPAHSPAKISYRALSTIVTDEPVLLEGGFTWPE